MKNISLKDLEGPWVNAEGDLLYVPSTKFTPGYLHFKCDDMNLEFDELINFEYLETENIIRLSNSISIWMIDGYDLALLVKEKLLIGFRNRKYID